MTQLADLPTLDEQIRHITHWQDMYVTSPEMQRAILASLHLIRELQQQLAAESLNGDAIMEIRRACAEIMGGNCAFVDDDFASCLYTMKAERDAALARAQAAEKQLEAERSEWSNHVMVPFDEHDRLEANDRRYRWLRDGNARDIAERWDFGGSEEGFQALKIAVQVFGEDWDAAIDAALPAQSDAKKEGE